MSRILPHLYLGGKDDAKDLTWLQSAGIKTIINCTPKKDDDPSGVPNYHEHSAQFVYKRVPFLDNASSAFQPALREALAVLESSQHYGATLVHCVQGVSRSAAVAAAYVVRTYGLSLEAALGLLKQARPQVKPNTSFLAHLRAFETEICAARKAGAIGPPKSLPVTPTAIVTNGEPSAGVAGRSPRKRKRHDDDGREQGCSALPIASPESCSPVADAIGPAGFQTAVKDMARSGPPPGSGTNTQPIIHSTDAAQSAACQECEASAATSRCSECGVSYCDACDAEAHAIASIGDHEGSRRRLASAT